MTEFDYQWKETVRKEFLVKHKDQYECNDKRVKEFLKLCPGLKPWYKKDSFVKDKICLDAGCGPGRWTCALQRLGVKKVDSFDISSEAIKICQKINPNAYVFDVMELKLNPVYDFVVSWGVLHHIQYPRKAFSKVASQVKKGGMLYVMIYDKQNDWFYDGFRGEACVEKHKYWESLSLEEKLKLCEEKSKTKGGEVHGWWDALNPTYNFSYTPDEIKQWFIEEGFTDIKWRKNRTYNVNMSGIKK